MKTCKATDDVIKSVLKAHNVIYAGKFANPTKNGITVKFWQLVYRPTLIPMEPEFINSLLEEINSKTTRKVEVRYTHDTHLTGVLEAKSFIYKM